LVRADRLTATERARLHTARAQALAKLGRAHDAVTAVGVADYEDQITFALRLVRLAQQIIDRARAHRSWWPEHSIVPNPLVVHRPGQEPWCSAVAARHRGSVGGAGDGEAR
jgi:hypothetical protein